jgi:uncharacterized OsmC-like protein
MVQIQVNYQENTKYQIHALVRDFTLSMDQPLHMGGDNTAATSIEFLLSALAGCVASMAKVYCQRHDIPLDGIYVDLTAEQDERLAVRDIGIRINLPNSFPVEHRDQVLAFAGMCPVKRTLENLPPIRLTTNVQA